MRCQSKRGLPVVFSSGYEPDSLMAQDRADSDEVLLTHEFLSMMLGTRRASVTGALHLLESDKTISTKRGRILICDRSRLEKVAGDSYGLAESEFARVGFDRKGS